MTKNKETPLEVSWGLLSALGSNRGKHNKCTETRGPLAGIRNQTGWSIRRGARVVNENSR